VLGVLLQLESFEKLEDSALILIQVESVLRSASGWLWPYLRCWSSETFCRSGLSRDPDWRL